MPCVLVRRDSASRGLHSTESFLISCARVETSPGATGLVESPSMERSKSKNFILRLAILIH